MQTQYGSDAEAAILGTERVFRARVLVDWNQNGLYDHALSDVSSFVESVDTDRALEGSAPEEILLVEGSSAAKVTVVLGGEYNDQLLSNLFSPYNATSPFFKKPTVGVELKYSIIVDSALGQYEYPQFVGKLRTITPDRASSTVEFTGFDRAEELRKPVLFPPFAMDDWWAKTNGRRKAQELDSSWFIDHCIRQCDTSPTPWRPTYREEMGVPDDGRDGTQLWVSGTGAHLPSVGWSTRTFVTQYPPVESLGIEMYSRNGQPHPDSPEPTLKPMCFNSTTSTAGDHRYWVADRDQINPASLHTFSFTLHDSATNGTWWRSNTPYQIGYFYIGGDYGIRILIGNGNLWTAREKVDSNGGVVSGQTITSSTVAVPSGAAVRCYIAWDLTATTGSRVYLKAGSNTSGWTTLDTGLGSGIAETSVLKGFCALYHNAAFSDFCYAVRDTFGLTPEQAMLNAGRDAKYAAVLDSGLQKLSYVPVKRGEDAWDVIKEVAASEQGSVFWDENGVFRFWNYSRILGLQDTPVRTFTLDDLSELKVTNSTDSIRNVWSVESTKSSSVYGILYNGSNADEFYVPNNTEAKIRLSLDGVVAADPSRLQKYSSSSGVSGLNQFQDTTLHGYVIEFLDGTWAEKDASPSLNIYCRCYYDAAGNLVVRITNTTGYAIRLSKIHIGGNIVSKYDPVVTVLRDADSVGLYGSRNYKLDGDWIQDGYDADRIRSTLMSRTLNPIPTTDSVTVAGDPRIQLADTVKLSDPDGFGSDLKVQIVGIGRRFSIGNGLEDTYTVQLISTDTYVPPVTDPDPPPTLTQRINWCPNPAAKNNATGWAGPSGYGRVTGITSMVRTTGVAQGSVGLLVGPKGECEAGKTYVYSAYVKGTSGASSGRVYLDWYNDSGRYMSSTWSNDWSVANGGVTRVDTGAQKAPNLAKYGVIVICQNSPVITATGLLYEEATAVGTYFDGDTSGAAWTGTNGNSVSTIG